MRSLEDIERLIKNAEMYSDPEANQVVLKDLMHQFDKIQRQKPAAIQPKIRRTIMRSPITKLAVAAAVITVVALVLSEFTGTGSTSGVVWADVARNVQASHGVIFRVKNTATDSLNASPDCTMNYLSGTHSRRVDSYKGEQITSTTYSDFNTKTVIRVDSSNKSYVKMAFEDMEQNNFLIDPKSIVQMFLSCEHRELGQKKIDGVLCEGIETTDPAFDDSGPGYTTDSVMARIWVSVETGYPVQVEIEIVRNNGEIKIGAIADQFQWDVELDEKIFEPNIPSDYIDISP